MEDHSNTTTQTITVPELLHHVTLTVIDYHTDESGATRSTYPLGSFGSLKAAKSFAETSLEGLGYQKDDFKEFSLWPQMHEPSIQGDGSVVYARAPAGQVFVVAIDTTLNTEQLPQAAKGDGLILPDGSSVLHYVMQTTIDYNDDRTGSRQRTDIEGVYAHRGDAQAAARKALDWHDFTDYHVRGDTGASGAWPYGEDTLVHAVGENGMNCTVAVKTVPGAHKAHQKKI
jgi:hypothetical protein